MRAGMAILIALTQLAGPWLCCCGPSRAVAAFAPVRSEPKPAAPKPSCPHCAKDCGKSSAPAEPAKPKPKSPPSDRCPCGGVVLVALPADKPERADPSLVAWLVPVSADFVRPVVLTSVIPADYPGLRELPVLTTSDRLFGHHALRC